MSDIPIFPNFSRLDIKHKDLMRKIAEEFPTYSDFNFVSMFTWDDDGGISVSDLNGNLIVKFSDYTTNEIYLSFLGLQSVTETIDTLLKYSIDHHLVPKLHLIGQAVIDSLKDFEKEKYKIEEDRDNHDYILSSELLSDIDQAQPQKRTKYRHFEREHGHKAKYQLLDLSDEKTLNEVDNLILDWQKIRLKTDDEVKREFSAIRRSLEHSNELNVTGYGTYVDNKLVAFTLFEIVHDKTAMLHFGKSDTNYKGLNEYHHNGLATFLVSEGINFMNNEQDLGIEGLRHAKMSSQPIDFLKKYKISFA